MSENLVNMDKIINQTSNENTLQPLIKFIPQTSHQETLQPSDTVLEIDKPNSETVKHCGENKNLIKYVPQGSIQEILQVPDVILEVDKSNTEDVKSRGKNKNGVKSCPVCNKLMRGDNIKRHLKRHNALTKSKYPKVRCMICGKSMLRNNLARHSKVHKRLQTVDQHISQSSDEILKRICDNQNLFEEKIRLGEQIHRILLDGDVEPMSLPKSDREALELYESYNTDVQTTSTLRPWQKTLLEMLDTPTEREIIWVVGEVGGEGKTWFQKYIEQYSGTRRVFRSSISNGPSLLHTLSKRMLACIDIFLINVPKSFGVGFVPYNVLEEIKDGRAISSKYDSKTMTFRTPNILVVFSNKQPRKENVSNDRWKILTIDKNTDNLKKSC